MNPLELDIAKGNGAFDRPYRNADPNAGVHEVPRRETFIEPVLKARTIAIIGFAESSWPPESVWADPTIEKWTLNHGHRILKHFIVAGEFLSCDVIRLPQSL